MPGLPYQSLKYIAWQHLTYRRCLRSTVRSRAVSIQGKWHAEMAVSTNTQKEKSQGVALPIVMTTETAWCSWSKQAGEDQCINTNSGSGQWITVLTCWRVTLVKQEDKVNRLNGHTSRATWKRPRVGPRASGQVVCLLRKKKPQIVAGNLNLTESAQISFSTKDVEDSPSRALTASSETRSPAPHWPPRRSLQRTTYTWSLSLKAGPRTFHKYHKRQ